MLFVTTEGFLAKPSGPGDIAPAGELIMMLDYRSLPNPEGHNWSTTIRQPVYQRRTTPHHPHALKFRRR